MSRTALLFALSGFSCLMGQPTSTGSAETKGPCSPAVSGNHNQFTINCQGISRQQGAEFLRILNRIARSQLDPKLVMSKLDEISSGIQEIQKRTGDRMLTESQEKALSHILRQALGTVSVVLLGDKEANAYGKALINVLTRSGWTVTTISIGILGPPQYGVQISGNAVLVSAFEKAGVPASETSHIAAVQAGRSAILVGLKP